MVRKRIKLLFIRFVSPIIKATLYGFAKKLTRKTKTTFYYKILPLFIDGF